MIDWEDGAGPDRSTVCWVISTLTRLRVHPERLFAGAASRARELFLIWRWRVEKVGDSIKSMR